MIYVKHRGEGKPFDKRVILCELVFSIACWWHKVGKERLNTEMGWLVYGV
jgi:hypothetical protein